ncbi:MAG: 30S ribosomal protein S2, partial [Bacteroidetes bacterium]|nr:30S ribosomal protein S2 [Bacteroidota bacterium]
MPNNIGYKELLDAGVHFGHLARKWDPRMAPYIFMERNGIHIIDLNKTIECLNEATASIKNVARTGRKILFVATKKQAKDAIQEEAKRLRMPYVTERWLGGMLTNFATIRKSIKKMTALDRMMKEDTYKNFTKKERLMKARKKEKIERVLGGISELNRLPTALFVVDVKKEFIAVNEAAKLNIPVYGMVDTNSNPEQIQFAIPSNDDSSKSIALITSIFGKAIEEGLEERKKLREEEYKSKEGQTEESDDTGESRPDDPSRIPSTRDREDRGDRESREAIK